MAAKMKAKMKAKKHRGKLDGRWAQEEREKRDLDAMRMCLELKLERHPDLKRQLLATRDAVIIEDCSKLKGGSGMFWGAAKTEKEGPDGKTVFEWEGRNELRKLWMQLRDALADRRVLAEPP